MTRTSLLVALSLLLIPVSGFGQVPPGWAVVSSASSGSTTGGGLYFLHPRTPGLNIAVTGLGPDLAPVGAGSARGANCVLRRRQDEALIVGEVAVNNDSCDLHVLTLSGSAVVLDQILPLGTAAGTFGGFVSQMVLLSSGDVVIAVEGLSPNGPLQGARLAIVNLTSGSVAPIPVPNLPSGQINALAVDASESTLYFGFCNTAGQIYSAPLAGGVPPTVIGTIASCLNGLVTEPSGQLVAAAINGLFRLDPATGSTTLIAPNLAGPAAVDIEAATEGFALVTSGSGQPSNAAYYVSPGGVPLLLGTPAWGFPTGIAVRPSPEEIGPTSGGFNAYRWGVVPGPQSLPTIGNQNFALTLQSTPAATSGVLGLAAAALGTPVTVNGVVLFIDPTLLLTTVPLPAVSPLTLPLPIPNVPALSGLSVWFQSLHADPSGLAASNALCVGLI